MSRCSAHNRRGQPCGRAALAGGTVCRYHGGRAPQVRQAAHVRLVESRARQVLSREGVEPVADPISALQQLAGEVVALKDLLAAKVSELQSWRYESRLGAEQLRSELLLLERAQDRAGRMLTDLAKLGLDERAVRVTEQQAAVIAQVLQRVLERLGLYRDDVRVALADELRLVASAAEPFGARGGGGRLG